MTQLESFSNQLLLTLFDYFDAVHLLHGFLGLNTRFDALLLKEYHSFHLDLRRISKQDFDFLCQQQNLRSVFNRIISLRLAVCDETPGLCGLFLSRGFNINQFTHLKSLTLNEIFSKELINSVHECRHLTHLNISNCSISFDHQTTSSWINRIWSLPKLTSCHIKNCYQTDAYFDEDTPISSTIEQLSLCSAMYPVRITDLLYLFTYTPCLRILSMNTELLDENQHFPTVQTSITTLKLVFQGRFHTLLTLLRSTPRLRRLSIQLNNEFFNGHQWQQLIMNNLAQLQTLQFKMFVLSSSMRSIDEQVRANLDTFRTQFWLVEHRWYVACDYTVRSKADYDHQCFYTLPYAFNSFNDRVGGVRRLMWTCPDTIPYWSFDRVHMFETVRDAHYQYQYPVVFHRIHDLRLSIPFADSLWSMISNLDHLTKLHVIVCDEGSDSQFRSLIERAIHLDTLIIDLLTLRWRTDILFNLTNPSIRQIKFFPHARRPWPTFDLNQCIAFAQSSIARQCQFLDIRVQSPESILTFANTMQYLQSMIIHVSENPNIPPRPTVDGMIEWTRNHLPNRYCLIDCTNSGTAITMKLWIG